MLHTTKNDDDKKAFGSQSFQPKEKEKVQVKKKAVNPVRYEFSTVYRGNVLHVTVNDTDSEESSFDSLDGW